MYQRETPEGVLSGRTFILAAARLLARHVEGMRDPTVGRDAPPAQAVLALKKVGLPQRVEVAKRSTADDSTTNVQLIPSRLPVVQATECFSSVGTGRTGRFERSHVLHRHVAEMRSATNLL